jgi:serine-aspartate repeat-containing protein C/D/E
VIIELVNSDDFAVQTVTLEDGLYDFFPVGAGDFTVRLQSNSLPLDTEANSDPDGENDSQTVLSVAPGETYSLSFGYASTGHASIEGSIWLETGNFGNRDAGEHGLNNVTVQLTDVSGTVITEMNVGADGAYRFEDLQSGNYVVRLVAETLPQPYGITFNGDDNYDLETSVSIESSEQAVTGIDFGVVGTF